MACAGHIDRNKFASSVNQLYWAQRDIAGIKRLLFSARPAARAIFSDGSGLLAHCAGPDYQDLHCGSFAITDRKIRFLDATDAAVSHHFFDRFDVFTPEDIARRKILEQAHLSGGRSIPARGEMGQSSCLAASGGISCEAHLPAIRWTIILEKA